MGLHISHMEVSTEKLWAIQPSTTNTGEENVKVSLENRYLQTVVVCIKVGDLINLQEGCWSDQQKGAHTNLPLTVAIYFYTSTLF